MSIKRMLKHRPKFPVIRYILGKNEWLKKNYPLQSLPSGMSIEGRTLKICLSRNVRHPLFRLTLNIFGIVPQESIDLKTGNLIGENLTQSGFYVLETKADQLLKYRLRSDFLPSITKLYPKSVSISYPTGSAEQVLKTLTDSSIAFEYDLGSDTAALKRIYDSYSTSRLAPVWFTGLVLNTKIAPFHDVDARRWFVNSFRKHFIKQELGIVSPESSLFSELLPGHRSFDPHKEPTTPMVKNWVQAINENGLSWAIKRKKSLPSIEKALKDFAEEFGITFRSPEVADGSHAGFPSFKGKKTLIQTTHSGFWALDPIGDIQMLFTPNLHQDMENIANDKGVIDMLSELSKVTDDDDVDRVMGRLNTKIYNDAIFNVISNQ